MDSLIGITGKDFVIFIADTAQARSILKMKGDEDKIMVVDESKMFAMAGDTGDRTTFCEYVKRNLKLYEIRSGLTLSTHAAAHWTRRALADALRQNPYQTNLLLGGWDEESGASLYYLDYLGSMHKMPFAIQGYASNFVLSIFDRYYKEDLTVAEGLELAKLCIAELNRRFLLAQPDWAIKVIKKGENGKASLEVIVPASK
eukprot:TRINITY_DN11504_c0_g1_i1.p1 TRINITY_DN11504_c0_g1~~TRINITY_DN11504_c0_g1_i1.p1  ORF type:complete len:201 (+),score=46.26 TRINITY_DN11504_c0_g1_i1:41-643(+)